MTKSDNSQASLPATKGDIQQLIAMLKGEIATKKDLKILEIATKKDLKKLEIATKKDLKKLEIATKKDLKKLETSLRSDMVTKSDLRQNLIHFEKDLLLKVEILFENIAIDMKGSYGDDIAWVKDTQKSHSKRIMRLEEKIGI